MLAAVCLTHELRQLKYDRPNLYGALAKNDLRELFADGDAFLKAIEPDGVYLAVECTGFSKCESPSGPPGFAREDGKLSFRGAVQAGLNYLKGASKKLSFARDINIAWTEWIIPIQPLDVVAPLPVWRPDFAGRIDQLLKNFVGRRFILDAFEEFRANKPCGYFHLAAEAGLGKSTTAAAVARRDDAPSYFFEASNDATDPNLALAALSEEVSQRHQVFETRQNQEPSGNYFPAR